MREIVIFLILFAFLFPGLTHANTNKGLAFDHTVYDCGRIYLGDPVRGVFHYTNKTDRKLLIKSVKTGCGCTVAKLTKNELEPGEFGEVEIKVKIKRFRGGPISYSAIFITEPPLQPRPTIRVKALTVLDVYLEPKTIFISKLSIDKPAKETVNVLSDRYPNFQITNITYNTNALKVQINKYQNTNTNLNISGYVLDITLFPAKIGAKGRNKRFRETVVVYTSVKTAKSKTLMITGYIR